MPTQVISHEYVFNCATIHLYICAFFPYPVMVMHVVFVHALFLGCPILNVLCCMFPGPSLITIRGACIYEVCKVQLSCRTNRRKINYNMCTFCQHSFHMILCHWYSHSPICHSRSRSFLSLSLATAHLLPRIHTWAIDNCFVYYGIMYEF